MLHVKPFAAASLFVVLMGTSAHAQIMADALWQEWKDLAASAGLELKAATELNDGGVLTLNGVSLSDPSGPGGITISELSLAQEDDGSVTVVPGDVKLDVSPAEGSVALTHTGFELNINDGEGGRNYGWLADALALTFDVTSPSTTDQKATNKGNVSLTAVEGTYVVVPGENSVIEIDLGADALAYEIASADPNLGTSTKQTNSTAGVALGAALTLPKTLPLAALTSPAAFRQALDEGLALVVTAEQGASTGTSVDENAFMPMTVTFEAGPGATEFSVDRAAMAVASSGESMVLTLASPMIPVPEAKITSGPVEVAFGMPLIADTASGDYGLTLKLSQFTLNEEAWAVFDPGAALPRDPADLAIDAGGKMKIDIMAMAEADAGGMTEVKPPEPETLDIRELTLKIAGAALSGTGSFTFDNSMVAAGGPPMPIGTADVQLQGGNGLIDKLIATGLVTEQDAMGARMMMGMFMTPAEGEDNLVSKVEAKAGGEIWVNGQRIQ